MVALKREIDKKIYLASPLFSVDFYRRCINFQNLCFETYTGWGADARLRTDFQRRRESCLGTWEEEWEDCFSTVTTEPNQIFGAYHKVMEIFAKDSNHSPQQFERSPCGVDSLVSVKHGIVCSAG